MKLTMTRVLTPLAALAFTLGAQATAVSTDGFESYSAGSSVTNATGWSFTAGGDGAPDASTVTAYGEAAKPQELPDGMTAGDNFLKLSTEDGVLFRNMNGTAAGGSVDLYQGLYVDTDVQFTLTDKSDRPTPDGADKFIIWLEADEDSGTTNLCVWAREYQYVEGTGIAANSNKVYKLNSADIAPGSWHRLTVKAIAQTLTMQKPIPGFQIYLDRTLVDSGDMMFPDAAQNSAAYESMAEGTPLKALIGDGLKFFPAMADELTTLSQVGFSGEGAIDNLVVTRDLPGFEEPTTVRFDFDMDVIESIDIDSLGVSLMSTNDTVSVASDATFTFSINWKTGYSAAMFNTTTSDEGYATVDGYEVTANGFGLGVITVTTAAKDTTDVTFTWDALNQAMGEQVTENTAIKFTIGENVYDADIENETSYTINGVKTGTNILVMVEFSNNKWVATFPTLPECMSANGMTLTLDTRPESGAVTVSISAEAAPAPVSIGGTPYDTLAEALVAATSADTITFNTDVTIDTAVSTAASTIDLNGKTLTLSGQTAVTFTGTGAKTLKGGDLTGVYHELTITAPAGEDLTFDGMTFHASVKPHGSNSVFTATNCQFLCDLDKTGAEFTDGSSADVHSYGVLFDSSSLFTQADIINSYFDQGRRAAVQASIAGDLYFYGNTVVADKLTSRVDGAATRYPALQIISNGRVFIENNTFSGQYLGEAFCVYNKGTYRTTDAPIVFNGNVVSNDVIYLWGIYDVDASGADPLVNPDLYFGANTVGANVDTEHCIYKTTVDGVDMNGITYSHTPATLALPTGVDTVYDWTHGANAGKMYVSGTGVTGFVNNLDDVAAGDTVTAVPGEVPVKANFTFTPGALKNQYTAALESYTITYMYDGSELTGLTPATYTPADAVTLPTVVDLGVVGVGFQAWTNAEGTVVTGWPAGGLTGNQTFYAQTAPVVLGEAMIVGGSSYATLAEAIEAASAGDTVQILKDCSVTNATGITFTKGITVTNDYTITIDGANYALRIANGTTTPVTFCGSGSIVWARGSGSPILVGCNEIKTSYGVNAFSQGSFVLDGITLTSTDATAKGGNLVKLEDGTFVLNSGTINGGTRGVKADSEGNNATCVLTINGGTIVNTNSAAIAASTAGSGSSTVTVNAGTFTGAITGTGMVTIPGNSTAKFDRDQSTFCASGYETVLSDGWYVVQAIPGAGTEPGAAVSGSPFASAEAATNAANSATIAVPAAVAAALTTEQQNAYKILFAGKVGEPVNGEYPVTMELTGEGAATIQSSADTAVAALAAKLTDAATAAQTVTVAAVPGFYYSIESGTEVNSLAEPQQRTLATGDTVTLTMPTLGTKGFYRVKISYSQLPVPQN